MTASATMLGSPVKKQTAVRSASDFSYSKWANRRHPAHGSAYLRPPTKNAVGVREQWRSFDVSAPESGFLKLDQLVNKKTIVAISLLVFAVVMFCPTHMLQRFDRFESAASSALKSLTTALTKLI